MRKRNLIVFAAVAGLVFAACGGDDDDDDGSNNNPSGCGDPVTGSSDCPEYVACAEEKCEAEYKQCLGDNFMSSDFSGSPCEEYMNCVLGCDCDEACLADCATNMAADCKSCLMGPLTNCVSSNCSAELQECAGTGTGGTGGGGSSGGTCADLEACCNSLPESEQSQCLSNYESIKAGGDSACGTLLQTYQASGKC